MGRSRHRTARTLHLEALEDRTLLDSGLASTTLDLSGLSVGTTVQDPSHILVTFRAGAVAASILPGTTVGVNLGLVSNLYEVNLTPSVSLASALAAYQANPFVLSAEPDYAVQIKQIPNDPDFPLQNNLANTGQNGGTVGADIHATGAWDVTHGSNSVVIAEMDTGIDYTHPDLYQNIWINQAEIPKSRLKNLVDVDHDGLITFADLNNPINQGVGKIMPRPGNTTGIITAADILAPMQLNASGQDTGLGGWADGSTQDGDTAHPDDLVGWNFAAASAANNYQGTNNPMDDNGHGTEVAGIMGATGNNGSGVAGVAWQTQIMPVKFMNASGTGDVSTFIQALNYAVQHGAKITNNSWGGADNSSTLYAAIQNAQAAGQIFVVAAGNDAANLDNTPEYPASFKLVNIVSVASTDRVDALAGYSNYGPKTVSIAAPGESIYTTEVGGTYGLDSGTSMATPEVTGALALVWGEHPTWTYSQVIAQVLNTADQVPYLKGKVLSGRLDVAAAVGTPVSPTPTPTPTPAPSPTPSPSSGTTYSSTSATNLQYHGAVISTIQVNGSFSISNLQVQLNLTHNPDSDLYLHLQGPDGTQVVLVNGRGGAGANFQNTTFADSASTPISQGSAPFAGTYQPESPLAAFNGKNVNGAWRLWVEDQNGNGNGALQSWSLIFNATPVSPTPTPTPTPTPAPSPTPTPSPSSGTTYSSTSAINLQYHGAVISTIQVNGSFSISNLQVQLNLTHNPDSDLYIHLQAPDGTQVVLVNGRGGAGANFQNTTFADSASTPISQGSAPFAGTYQPESPLAAFNGKNVNGAWRLWVEDQNGNGNGALQSWSLTFNAA